MGLERGREAARRRWALLARALLSSRRAGPRLPSLGLVRVVPDDDYSGWYDYVVGDYTVKVKHVSAPLSPRDLMGFNNTGNVRVWPSEEVLAYYVLATRDAFDGKSVLELGGGMTCLAGLFVSKYTSAVNVHLTDGNINSVENVKEIVEENRLGSKALCGRLKWGKNNRTKTEYDVLLAADCLFFDDSRSDLVATMWKYMKGDGAGLVTAPRRGSTLDRFLEEAAAQGFCFSLSEYYHPDIWERHLALQADCPDYDADVHYPVLIRLSKSPECRLVDKFFL